MSKSKLNYVPWVVKMLPGYRSDDKRDAVEIQTEGYGMPESQKIFDRVHSWRKFPVSFGDGGDRDSIYILLDRIATPFALLDPAMTLIAKQERIKPNRLPKNLADLYSRLVALGHAEASPEIGGET